MVPPIVFWFRRDLRCRDQPALARAITDARSNGAEIAALFVLDSRLLRTTGSNRTWLTLESVRALRSSGIPVFVRSGKPESAVTEFARSIGSPDVRASDDFTPYGRQRDLRVSQALAATGSTLALEDGPYVVTPGTVRKQDDTPFKVFTPFNRVWAIAASGITPSLSVDPRSTPWLRMDPSESFDAPFKPSAIVCPEPTEEAANELLKQFVENRLETYDSERDRPDLDASSRLSPYLKVGLIHPRTVLAAVDASAAASTNGARIFRNEICWREFYADVLFHRPDSRVADFAQSMETMSYDTGPLADERFEAWAKGRTGYPFIDAGMRQLRTEGWMHNRVRMAAASFLVKDLHVDWRRGAKHFLDHLFDGDIASNQHGWQWTAGTGTDAAPYFRIFNPVSQGLRFDPQGTYVRRYVSELADVGKNVHEPWLSDAVGSLFGQLGTYPSPIVLHAEERDEALRRYRETRPA